MVFFQKIIKKKEGTRVPASSPSPLLSNAIFEEKNMHIYQCLSLSPTCNLSTELGFIAGILRLEINYYYYYYFRQQRPYFRHCNIYITISVLQKYDSLLTGHILL